MRLPRRHREEEREPVELAALADGSLPPERRAALEARVAASPELATRLEEQRRALASVRGIAVEAPARLRARVEAERRTREARSHRGRLAFGGAVAVAAAAALALLVVLPGGVAGPTVAQAAELAVRPATQPPPNPNPQEPKLLDRSLDGVPFPNWTEKFGWEAIGARTDEVGGRRTETVFYGKRGKRIAYTIVSGDALRVPDEARSARREGSVLHTFASDGRLVVTWLRGGRTCVLSGIGVESGVLLELAAWKGKGAVPF